MTLSNPKCRWVVGTIFFLSLAANVFLAGFLLGDCGDNPPPPRPGMFFEAFNDKAKALPEPSRTDVRKVLAKYSPEMKRQMKRVMKSRQQVDTLLQSKNYTRADAEAAFAKLQDESLVGQQLGQEMMLEIADALPPEHRAGFMERPKEWRGRGAEFKGPSQPAKN